MNSIEEKLWDYMDGSCTPQEHTAIKLLIEHDTVYRKKYQELLKMNNELLNMELDEPPMAFTYHVMEAIRAQHASQPLKAAIDKRIINGIGLFFVFTISIILLYILAGMHWSAGGMGVQLPAKLQLPHLKIFTAGPLMKGLVFFDVVLTLYLVDSYLRKKNQAKKSIQVHTNVQRGQQDNG